MCLAAFHFWHVDPYQLASQKQTDLDPHCFQNGKSQCKFCFVCLVGLYNVQVISYGHVETVS